MYKVLSCLRDQHDYRLVLLAVLICAVATFTAFHIYASARQSQGSKRLGWIFLTGVATGAGIWATHFVPMLAFKTGMATAYDPALTLASLLIAIGVTAAGFLIAVQGNGRWQPALGGGVIGVGIAAMHFTGMRAFTTTGTVSWDSTIVLASIVLGVVFAAAALVNFHSRPRPWTIWSAAGLLTLAICSLHFTAMGAAVITPDPTIVVYPYLIDNSTMAIAVAGVTFLVIFAALASALIDKETVRESGYDCMSLPTRPPRELSSPRMATLSTSISGSPSFPNDPARNCSGRECSATCSWHTATPIVPLAIAGSRR